MFSVLWLEIIIDTLVAIPFCDLLEILIIFVSIDVAQQFVLSCLVDQRQRIRVVVEFHRLFLFETPLTNVIERKGIVFISAPLWSISRIAWILILQTLTSTHSAWVLKPLFSCIHIRLLKVIMLLLVSDHVANNSLLWVLFSISNGLLKPHFLGFRSTPWGRCRFLRSVVVVGHLLLNTDLLLLTFAVTEKRIHVVICIGSVSISVTRLTIENLISTSLTQWRGHQSCVPSRLVLQIEFQICLNVPNRSCSVLSSKPEAISLTHRSWIIIPLYLSTKNVVLLFGPLVWDKLKLSVHLNSLKFQFVLSLSKCNLLLELLPRLVWVLKRSLIGGLQTLSLCWLKRLGTRSIIIGSELLSFDSRNSLTAVPLRQWVQVSISVTNKWFAAIRFC